MLLGTGSYELSSAPAGGWQLRSAIKKVWQVTADFYAGS